VISVRIVSNGTVNIEKVGELMDAPMYRFGKDTGETERMLMEYLQQENFGSDSLSGSSICMLKVNPLFPPVSMVQNLNQKLLAVACKEKFDKEPEKYITE